MYTSHFSLSLAVQDILFQLQRLVTAISRYNDEAAKEIRTLVGLFPVEMDLKEDVFQYKQNPFQRFNSEDHESDSLPSPSSRAADPTPGTTNCSSAPAEDLNIIDLS